MTRETLHKAISAEREISAREKDRELYLKMLDNLLHSESKEAVVVIKESDKDSGLQITVNKAYAETLLHEFVDECNKLIETKKAEIELL